MKKFITKTLARFGYKILKLHSEPQNNSAPEMVSTNQNIFDLEQISKQSSSVPGMITSQSGKHLFMISYLQCLSGDIVEIGSWQGRSTGYLAESIRASGNGRLFAIDHFKGNAGKEDQYMIEKEDLSDLKNTFISNMKRANLWEFINLLNMDCEKAVKRIKENSIRFIFIDGNHSQEGVEKDIRLFLPKMKQGGIIVFDDFSKNFPGLIIAIEKLIKNYNFSRIVTYKNTLVLKLLEPIEGK